MLKNIFAIALLLPVASRDGAGSADRINSKAAAGATHRPHRSGKVSPLDRRARRRGHAWISMQIFGNQTLDTNLAFMHRGVIAPHSGIGAHFHNQCEEMFIILDGEAQFTIDGRTSLLKGPAGAPDRLGHSHGIYNATDKPVQWINFNVGYDQGRLRYLQPGRHARRCPA